MTGAVPPCLVMLPGLDGTGQLSVAFLAAVRAHGVPTRALSLPSNGPQDYASLLQLLRPQLPSQPFVLLGESFAGPLAMQLAAEAPPALRGLALCTTFARRPLPVPAAGAALLAPAWPMPPLLLLSQLLLGRWRSRQTLRELRLALAQVPAATLRQRAAATLRVDARQALPRIAVPTLCLQARQDRLLWPPSVAELQALLPDARHVTLEGPHFLLQARTDAAATVVSSWVRALPG